MMKSDLVDIELVLRMETEKAFGVCLDECILDTIWLPKSQCEHDGAGLFTMPEWLAVKEGLI